MNSKIYAGQVRHRRHIPHDHHFSYKLFMMYLDLDELPELFDPFMFWSADKFNLAYFNRKDHMGDPAQSLKQSVFDLVLEQTGIQLNGPVRLLTNLRYFGYGFNPVSFFYCFTEDGNDIVAIVAEVNNTPWGEQYCYVFPDTDNQGSKKKHRYELEKSFHVSPFNPMDQHYKWSITSPQQQLSVHIENWKEDAKVFDASLTLQARPVNSASLTKTLKQFPLMTAKVTATIYYQALKLLLKRTPLYPHPDKILQPQTRHK